MSFTRQDKIISNNRGMPLEGSTQIAHSLSFPNDSSHVQQHFCTPDLTPRLQQSGSVLFNHALEGDQMSTSLISDLTSQLGHSSCTLFNQTLEPDQTFPSLAPNSLLQSEQNCPHDPRCTTWFHEHDIPPVNHYLSNHTTSLPHAKHHYTTTKEGKAQGSSTNTRRRRKSEAKYVSSVCIWTSAESKVILTLT